MTKTLLGIGECMVELSQADDGLLRKAFAGDVFNSLWHARQALPTTWDVSFLSAVGNDPMSDQMVTFIQNSGISCRDMRRLDDRRPGLYMIHLDGAERSFSYWRETSAARNLAADHAHLSNAIQRSDVIYLSGITLAILPDEDVTALLAELGKARAAGKLVTFDSNIRPSLWSNENRMRDLIGKAASVSGIVFPSFDDEQAAFGDGSPEETCQRYEGYGAGAVVLKNGSSEVCICTAGTTTFIPTPSVSHIVDTTGAGDSFNGAFLAEFLQSENLAKAVKFGQACAGEVIGCHGALVQR